jgi:putative membrane protein
VTHCSRKVGTVASESGAPEFQPSLRLHRSSWLFALTGSLRQLIFPLVAIVVFGARDDGDWFATPWVLAIVATAVFVHALWRQWTYRYGFGPRGLVIREGLIFRNVRQIEYSRIENVDTERGVLHRLLDVAEVRVQTSTGGKPEALISVLDPGAVQEMRQRVFADARPTTEAAAAPEEPRLLHLPPSELVRFGLIDNRGLLVVAAGAGFLQQAGFFRANRKWMEDSLQTSLLNDVAGLGMVLQIGLALLVILAALIAVRILSVVLALVTLHDFTLTRHDGDLRVRYGLLTKVALTLRTRRIQAVHQSESPLHRLFGRVSINVDLAGDSGVDVQQRDPQQMKVRWLAPVCATAAAPALIASALPDFDSAATRDWQPLAPGARSRIFRRSAVLALLILAIPALWFLRGYAALGLPVVVTLAWMHAHLYVKHTRWALDRDVLLFQSGWLTRRLTIVPRDRVQSLGVSTSPFDRRWQMASVTVDIAGGRATSSGVRIRYLPAAVAKKLAASLYESVDVAAEGAPSRGVPAKLEDSIG